MWTVRSSLFRPSPGPNKTVCVARPSLHGRRCTRTPRPTLSSTVRAWLAPHAPRRAEGAIPGRSPRVPAGASIHRHLLVHPARIDDAIGRHGGDKPLLRDPLGLVDLALQVRRWRVVAAATGTARARLSVSDVAESASRIVGTAGGAERPSGACARAAHPALMCTEPG
eukprot:6916224-Prymnesium_polylepis.1